MPKHKHSVEQIEALLPQTQCTLCGFSGCAPYAQAIADHAIGIDQCLPGGIPVLKALGALTQQNVSGQIESMKIKQKAPSCVTIDPEACIGCTQCIQVCPVDAIMGTAKRMHSIISSECTGCALCIPACPVDCITEHTLAPPTPTEATQRAQLAKRRYLARQIRLAKQHKTRHVQHQAAKLGRQNIESKAQLIKHRQQEIVAAMARAQERKNTLSLPTQVTVHE